MLTANNIQEVADRIIHLARQQGHITPHDVAVELAGVGLSEDLVTDVLALARACLSYRDGRYHFINPVSDRVRAEQALQHDVQEAIDKVISHYQANGDRFERRERGRIDFVQVVKVVTEDEKQYTLLTRDLSATGLRLIGTRHLLGQKVRVLLPAPDGGMFEFLVRVLWTCPVGEDLIENGGTFLSMRTTSNSP